MGENLLIGCGTMAICLAIQCVVVSVLLHFFYRLEAKKVLITGIPRSSAILIAVMIVLFAGNLVQMALWAYMFLFLEQFEDFRTAFYHSVVNFTTLGYGDLVMTKERRLLGALEAANGVLMFGLSTSVLFSVLRIFILRRWQEFAAKQ